VTVEEGVLDLTDQLTENVRRARAFHRDSLILVISADNCPGCEELAWQLDRPAVRDVLAGSAYVVRLKAGDLYANPPRTVRIGTWTLETVGFPTTWVWGVEPEEIRFRSVALGPLQGLPAAEGFRDLTEGRSLVVREAQGAKLTACSGGFCLVLDRANEFRQDFAIPV
jgi:hypothetical protein